MSWRSSVNRPGLLTPRAAPFRVSPVRSTEVPPASRAGVQDRPQARPKDRSRPTGTVGGRRCVPVTDRRPSWPVGPGRCGIARHGPARPLRSAGCSAPRSSGGFGRPVTRGRTAPGHDSFARGAAQWCRLSAGGSVASAQWRWFGPSWHKTTPNRLPRP